MEKSTNIACEAQKTHWLELVETLSVVGALGGTAAAFVSQQIIFASLPLSLSLALNLVNRRRLLQANNQASGQAIAQLREQHQHHQSQWMTLNQVLPELQQGVQALTQQTSTLQETTQALHQEQKQTHDVAVCLREIELLTSTILANPNFAKSYYLRGVIHQRLGDHHGAIADYTAAVRLQPSFAKAYHNLGIARSHLSDRKGAIEDLRNAAKLFFEQGDIASYQKSRDLGQRLHELNHEPPPEVQDESAEALALEGFFS